ncbi:cell division protein ZapB [Candidatus Berkiella aquae]|uniref:Cell division protein ZapB n=1 Tax=Candidatus Berkiella aquae TaxID=295108 RepID=A0A0Q9YZU7_9GAMM|nr:cell division protein ZapB [Candidatus Berkiella aquae]MCS5712526.1 cell division protein ZapB [Candidatus Berkiella aquae]
MTTDLLQKLELKVANAVEVIELLRMQIEELETENTALKAEHDKWRRDLVSLIKRFDQIEEKPASASIHKMRTHEEEFMSV